MAILLTLRMLAWITITTLALTTLVTTASIMTIGVLQTRFPGSVAVHMKAMTHSLLVALVGLFHTAPQMPVVLLVA